MEEFDKIVGNESAKEELKRIADAIRNPKKYQEFGVKIPRGILLYGESGVGKTFLAKSFVKACGVKSLEVGIASKSQKLLEEIKNAFTTAKFNSPCVIFLGNLDKIVNENEAHDNLSALKILQSCFEDVKDDDVFVVATISTLAFFPNSLMQSNCFDSVIKVNCLLGQDSIEIIRQYLEMKKQFLNIDINQIARILNSSTIAEVEKILNQASFYAAYKNKEQIETDDFIKAILKIKFKVAEKLEPCEKEILEELAYHVAGHIVVSELFKPNSIALATIHRNEGLFGGFLTDSKQVDCLSFEENQKHVNILLGGKAAVFVALAKQAVDSGEDVNSAFRVLSDSIDRKVFYGFKCVEYDSNMSNEFKKNREEKIFNQMKWAYDEDVRVLTEHKNFLDAVAKALIEKETLLAEDIAEIRKNFV